MYKASINYQNDQTKLSLLNTIYYITSVVCLIVHASLGSCLFVFPLQEKLLCKNSI